MSHFQGVLFVALACSCSPPSGPPAPLPPPGVFLTVDESNVIGNELKGKVSVSGCSAVTQVQLLQEDAFLTDLNFTQNPTEFSLPAGTFSSLFPQLGIAAPLTLKAKVVCGDGRTNNSIPVGVRFFPIANRVTASAGQLAVPNNFVAEGGLNGASPTFLGCAATTRGTKLTRVNVLGAELTFNEAIPFPCDLSTQITEESSISGTRWVLQPNQGAYSIDHSLTVRNKVTNSFAKRIGVGPKGAAAIWLDDTGLLIRIVKASPTPSATDWEMKIPVGIVNSNPIVDDGAGMAVWASEWIYDSGSHKADILALKFDLNTGEILSQNVILTQQYPLSAGSLPITPEGVFSSDGAFFTFPLLAYDPQLNVTSTVVSCATSALEKCEGTARRWTSPPLPGMIRLVLPFSQGNLFAAAGSTQVYFLNAQMGTILNLADKPLKPSGSQIVLGLLPGRGTDFYVLTGPDLGSLTTSYPTEIIATDAPASGELWRMQYGGGTSSDESMHIDVDEGQQVWVRAGTDLIKPLPNSEYRSARGPTK